MIEEAVYRTEKGKSIDTRSGIAIVKRFGLKISAVHPSDRLPFQLGCYNFRNGTERRNGTTASRS